MNAKEHRNKQLSLEGTSNQILKIILNFIFHKKLGSEGAPKVLVTFSTSESLRK